jgi:DUF4097 and DUF4098 domain-containing protein YvlB
MVLSRGRIAALAIGLPIVVALLALGALNLVGLLSQTSETHSARYQWQAGEISVDTSAGDIRVVAGSGSQVSVSYTEHYQLKKPTVSATTSNGGVQLTGRCPSGILDNNCAIDYVVTVPASSGLTLHTGAGNISAAGSSGNGSLSTGSGNIGFTDLSGDIVAHTGSGNVSGTRTSSKHVHASTGVGDVNVEWINSPSSVVTETGSGDIGLVLPRGSGPYRTSTHTGVGSTDVSVATDPTAAFSISATTGVGNISISFGTG